MKFGKNKSKAQPVRENAVSSGAKVGKILINLLVTVIFGLVYFYLQLPALNLQDETFYFFMFLLAGVYCVIAIITSGIYRIAGKGEFLRSVKNNFKAPLIICAALLLLLIGGMLVSGVMVRARAYSALLPVTTGDFAADVDEISYDRIPMLDSDSARRLGDRKLGELADMVSQFEVADSYTQINYQDRPVRVTPLEYGDVVKWASNRREGLPGYILIDMVTQRAEVVRLEEGMKYSTDEYFMRNINRYLRFQYPTYMFATPSFEIDEAGVPYWVCPRVIKTIGLFGGRDIQGVVLVNAVTGEHAYYQDPPEWVDRVYSADLIIAQYDYYGQYASGFLNSLFGQRGVTVTTEGYNYIAMNDAVYLYTGVTSVGGDESNVGFILSNLRTKETRYYEIAGAEEYSAMSSAEGIVQHLGYTATFPLLLNVGGEPTYFMALKDDAGLVKMYAMVNVRQYQIVANGTSLAQCEANYLELLRQNNLVNLTPAETTGTTGVVIEIRTAVVGGDSVYYLQLDNGSAYYAVNAAQFEAVVTLNIGDTVTLEYAGNGDILQVSVFSITARGVVSEPASAESDTALSDPGAAA